MRQSFRVVFEFLNEYLFRHIFGRYVFQYLIVSNVSMLLGAINQDIYLIVIGIGAIIFLILYFKILSYLLGKIIDGR